VSRAGLTPDALAPRTTFDAAADGDLRATVAVYQPYNLGAQSYRLSSVRRRNGGPEVFRAACRDG
jgi:hypothetical protein